MEHKKTPTTDRKDSVLLMRVCSNYLQICCFCLHWSKQLPKVRTKQAKMAFPWLMHQHAAHADKFAGKETFSPQTQIGLIELMRIDFNCNSLDTWYQRINLALNRLSGKQKLHERASHDKPVYHAIPWNETSGTGLAFSTAEEEMKQWIQQWPTKSTGVTSQTRDVRHYTFIQIILY